MRRRKAPSSTLLKNLPRTPGRNRAGEGRRGARHRNLVRRRGAYRPEKQAHQALGEARLSAVRAQGSAHRLDLYFRRDLAQGRQGRGPRAAQMRHLCDEPASRRNRQKRRPWRARRAAPRSGRLAHDGQARPSGRHHHAVGVQPIGTAGMSVIFKTCRRKERG